MIEHVPAGLYLHVPFCKTKCPYCDFYSVTRLSSIPDWFEAVKREMLLWRDLFPCFDTLYLGGGTPSLLPDRALQDLHGRVRGLFRFSEHTEFTVEVNPDDVDSNRLAALRDLGVNRISLGVQSFDDKELCFLKRRHTADQAIKAVHGFKEAAFAKVSLDLMYGLPGQTGSGWIKTLEKAASFKPEHISCYQLTIHENTPFGRLQAKGEIKGLGEGKESAFFMLTSAFLKEKGYLHYEVSNFARGEENLCRHNLKYWSRAPYLGLGPSAHSSHAGSRWWNFRELKEYGRALSEGRSPIAGKETLTQDQVYLETLLLGFRTRQGVDRAVFHNRPGTEEVLRHLAEAGLVQTIGGRVVPTVRGFLVADSLPLLLSD